MTRFLNHNSDVKMMFRTLIDRGANLLKPVDTAYGCRRQKNRIAPQRRQRRARICGTRKGSQVRRRRLRQNISCTQMLLTWMSPARI